MLPRYGFWHPLKWNWPNSGQKSCNFNSRIFLGSPWGNQANFWHGAILPRESLECLIFWIEVSLVIIEYFWIDWKHVWNLKLHFSLRSIKLQCFMASFSNCMLKTLFKSQIGLRPYRYTMTKTFLVTLNHPYDYVRDLIQGSSKVIPKQPIGSDFSFHCYQF